MKRYLLIHIFFVVLFSSPLSAAAETPVTLETSHGRIGLVLDERRAPLTVANFAVYARSGFYDGTIFHRVIPGFMIQGGGFGVDMRERMGLRAPIRNEADNGLNNERYTVAMARRGEPHSATSQFFINVADNAFLNHRGTDSAGYGYAVFGRVVSGFDTVDKIAAVPTRRQKGHDDVPYEPVRILRVRIGLAD